MFGLMVLLAFALYLIISLMVVRKAITYARRHGKSTKRWGWGAALAMYMLVFWDWIPTVVTHKYYCSTEAGFWVYKTVDQWKAENPGVFETLVADKSHSYTRIGDQDNYIDTSFLNQRFIYVFKRNGPLLLNRWRKEAEIVDGVSKEVLAREIDFYTSHQKPQAGWNGWKFWFYRERCGTYAHRDEGGLTLIAQELKGESQ